MNQDQTPQSPQQSKSMLEAYKFYAEIYDRMEQRRHSINRLYLHLLMTIAAFVVVSLRFPSDALPMSSVLSIAGLLGMVLSVAWLTQLNASDFLLLTKKCVLIEAEIKMSLLFFSREQSLLGELEIRDTYSKAEKRLPYLFLACSAILWFVGWLD